MMADLLKMELAGRFPNSEFRTDASDGSIVLLAAHEEVGDVSILDDGDELTVYIGTITHGHFSYYDWSSLLLPGLSAPSAAPLLRRIARGHQLIIKSEARGPGFVNKRHSLSRKVLPHIVQQLPRTIWQTQRALQSPVIRKGGSDAMMVHIQPREDVVIARDENGNLNLS